MKKDKVNKPKFVDEYFSLDDKIKFLQSFDLINLQKAAKIGNIPSSKLKTRRSTIKSILAFDLKNKFLICENIFNNLSEYYKKKVDDVYTFKTLEWNQYEFDHKKAKEWELIKDDLQKENQIFFNQININAENVTIPLGTLQEPNTEILLSSLDSTNTLTLNKTIDWDHIEDITNNANVKERIVTSVKGNEIPNEENIKTKKAITQTSGPKYEKSSSKVSLDQIAANDYNLMNDSNTSALTGELTTKTTKMLNNKINKKMIIQRVVQLNKNKKENTFDNNAIVASDAQILDAENSSKDFQNINNNNEKLNIKHEIKNMDANIEHKTIKDYILNNLSKLNQIINKLSTMEENIHFNQKILNYLKENINKIVANQEKLFDLNKKHQDFIEHVYNNGFSKLSLNMNTYNKLINQIMNDNKNILSLLLVVNNKIKLNSSLENNTKKDSSNFNNDNSSVKDKLFESIKHINNIQEAIKSYQLNDKNNEKLNNRVCYTRYKIKTANTSKIDDKLLIQEQIRHKNNLEQLWKKHEEFKSNNKCENSLKALHNDIRKTNDHPIHNDGSNDSLKNTLEKLKDLQEQNNRLFKENDILKSQYHNKDLFDVKVIKKIWNTTSAK